MGPEWDKNIFESLTNYQYGLLSLGFLKSNIARVCQVQNNFCEYVRFKLI